MWQRVFFLDLILVIFIAFSAIFYYSMELKGGAEKEIGSRSEASIVSSRLSLAASYGEKK